MNTCILIFLYLFVPYILWLFFKGHGEKLFGKVLSKNILLTAYEIIFQLFKFIYSIGLWLFFWKGSLNHHFIQPCILIFFNFSNLFIQLVYGCFFEGHGEKLFMQRYEQWFMQRYEQWFWYNPDRYSGQIFRTDIFNTTNLVYLYQEMSGTLCHRSEGFSSRIFIQPCISTFSTFQNYLFHIFYVCFFKGPGEKSFYTFSHFKRPFLYNENYIKINYRIIYDLFFLWSKNINF